MQTIEERVKNVIVQQLGVEPHRVVPTATLVTDMYADSLDTIELVMALEEEFGLQITESDWDDIPVDQLTVQHAIDVVKKHVKPTTGNTHEKDNRH